MSTLADILTPLNASSAPVAEGWHIDGRESALWAMKKLWDLRQTQADRRAEADAALAPLRAQIAMVEGWLADETDALEQDAQFFEGHLLKWHAQQRAADPKAASIKFAYGTLASRKSAAKLEIPDEKATLAALKEAGRTEFVRTKEELDKVALKEAVLKDGEVLPGITVAEESVTFAVKLAEVPDGV